MVLLLDNYLLGIAFFNAFVLSYLYCYKYSELPRDGNTAASCRAVAMATAVFHILWAGGEKTTLIKLQE
jgi:hypothetical protein